MRSIWQLTLCVVCTCTRMSGTRRTTNSSDALRVASTNEPYTIDRLLVNGAWRMSSFTTSLPNTDRLETIAMAHCMMMHLTFPLSFEAVVALSSPRSTPPSWSPSDISRAATRFTTWNKTTSITFSTKTIPVPIQSSEPSLLAVRTTMQAVAQTQTEADSKDRFFRYFRHEVTGE